MTVRMRKLFVMLVRPRYWHALALGVAPTVEHAAILRSIQVDGIIDVGANRGQFSLACRFAMPGIPIVAFEPIPAEAEVYRQVHAGQPEIVLVQTALGNASGTALMHISRSADSSSLLPIGKKQTEYFSDTAEIGTITVPVNRLDDQFALWAGRTRQLLKLDVQGFELNVLLGSRETLKTCAFVYAECSEIALYDGQALRQQVQDCLKREGFEVKSRHNEQWDGSNLIQADWLFEKRAREI